MQPDSATDADLLSAHVAGDPHAFSQLYDRYDPAIFLFVRRTLGGAYADAAEEVHQETWTAVARSARAFSPLRATFRTWVFTIARRKVWDLFRSRRVAVISETADEAAIAAVPDPGPTPFDQVESREQAERIAAAVDALPLAQRETFVLFAQAGLSLQEIADATEVSVETAKSRLRYARVTLRRSLAGESMADA